MLRSLKNRVKIMVSDYVSNNANIPDAVSRSKNEGFTAFPRGKDNYNYKYIPVLSDANTNDILALSDVCNYLYLIDTDNYTSKEQMLDAIAETDYDLVLIDLFFENDILGFPDIEKLKTKHNGKKRLVISYISVGSAETYRYYWRSGWKKGSPSWIKKRYAGYPDEYWVNYWHTQWLDIIFGNDNSYIKKIIDAGFDGAYLDNVEAYYLLER